MVQDGPFYKELANNPNASHDELARNVGISRTMAYTYLDDLKTAWAVTSDDANFPRKLLLYHNHHLPAGTDHLSEEDIERLRPLMLSAINSKEAESAFQEPMGSNMGGQYATYNDPGPSPGHTPETGTNEGLLKTILLKMRYVSPGTIERFLENYRLNEEDFAEAPRDFIEFYETYVSDRARPKRLEIFKTTQGKYVDASMGGQYHRAACTP